MKMHCLLYRIIGLAISILLIAAFEANAGMTDVTLSWDPPIAVDGNPNPEGVKGYRIYQSNAAGIFDIKTGKVAEVLYPENSAMIKGLPDGKYYFVATAFDQAGNESGFSNEVSAGPYDTTPPGAPGNLKSSSINISVIVTTDGK